MNRLIGDRYRVGRPLGSGGMGEVWEALDVRLDRRVAVKLLKPASQVDDVSVLITRFQREARMTAKLNHRGVPAVHDTGTDGKDMYLVMELVEGADLTEFQAENVPIPASWIAAAGAQIASVLGAAHSAGLVHRDLKPRNVMITDAGDVKVLDFGIATLRDSDVTRLTRTAESLGTPAYMAPEQAMHGVASPSSDLYSLGCVLYELATGTPVFQADTPLALMHRHYADTPVPLSQLRPDIPVELTALIDQLLAKHPGSRPSTAAEVYDRLIPLIGNQNGPERPMDPTRPFRPHMSAPSRPAPPPPQPPTMPAPPPKQPQVIGESAMIIAGFTVPLLALANPPSSFPGPAELIVYFAVGFALVYPGAVMRQRRLKLSHLWSIAAGLRWTRPPRPGNKAVELILFVLSSLMLLGIATSEYPLKTTIMAIALAIPAALMRQRRLGKLYPWLA